jgi:hypothetical protein
VCAGRAGAGNQLPVVALDILHALIADDKVVLVKMNPVNDYYGPLLRQVRGRGCALGLGACAAHTGAARTHACGHLAPGAAAC